MTTPPSTPGGAGDQPAANAWTATLTAPFNAYPSLRKAFTDLRKNRYAYYILLSALLFLAAETALLVKLRWEILSVRALAENAAAFEKGKADKITQDALQSKAVAERAQERQQSELDKLRQEVANLIQQNSVIVQQQAKLVEETRSERAKANEADARQKAEREEKEAHAATQKEVAANSALRQAAEARAANAEAAKKEAEAWIWTGQLPPNAGPALRMAARGFAAHEQRYGRIDTESGAVGVRQFEYSYALLNVPRTDDVRAAGQNAIPPEAQGCASIYNNWVRSSGFKAFAASATRCGTGVNKRDAMTARQAALAICQKGSATPCRVIEEVAP